MARLAHNRKDSRKELNSPFMRHFAVWRDRGGRPNSRKRAHIPLTSIDNSARRRLPEEPR